jgi:hypothetical protein
MPGCGWSRRSPRPSGPRLGRVGTAFARLGDVSQARPVHKAARDSASIVHSRLKAWWVAGVPNQPLLVILHGRPQWLLSRVDRSVRIDLLLAAERILRWGEHFNLHVDGL